MHNQVLLCQPCKWLDFNLTGFLRWSDFAQIRLEQLFFCHSHMSIYLKKRNYDQFCDGQYVHISKSGLSTCPVNLTKRSLCWSRVSKGPLLRGISGHGINQKITCCGLLYSQACALEEPLELLERESLVA